MLITWGRCVGGPENTEQGHLRSYRLDYPYFEVRIAKDPAIDEGFVVRRLKAILPKHAGERSLEFSFEEG